MESLTSRYSLYSQISKGLEKVSSIEDEEDDAEEATKRSGCKSAADDFATEDAEEAEAEEVAFVS